MVADGEFGKFRSHFLPIRKQFLNDMAHKCVALTFFISNPRLFMKNVVYWLPQRPLNGALHSQLYEACSLEKTAKSSLTRLIDDLW